ncbi:MAG: hypothetical protein RJA83_349 [Pseudomonadota bacterium]|jgi:hypothetical protein
MKAVKIPEFDHIKFISKIKVAKSGCWEWQGNIFYGYGRFSFKSKAFLAHRCSYYLFNGELLDSLVIDHMCMNKKCVNPDHLRQVTRTLNTLENSGSMSALNSKKTHCKRGHEFNEENTRYSAHGSRTCRKCANKHSISGRRKKVSKLKMGLV